MAHGDVQEPGPQPGLRQVFGPHVARHQRVCPGGVPGAEDAEQHLRGSVGQPQQREGVVGLKAFFDVARVSVRRAHRTSVRLYTTSAWRGKAIGTNHRREQPVVGSASGRLSRWQVRCRREHQPEALALRSVPMLLVPRQCSPATPVPRVR